MRRALEWFQPRPQRFHWFVLAYQGESASKDGEIVWASICTGFRKKRVTRKRIQQGKSRAGVSDGAVFVSATYLGLMSVEEFRDEDRPDAEQG